MKSGKAVGPDDIPVEVWKCLGEAAVEFLASLFNRVLENLEKAYDRLPREELWYCMRKSGVAEKYVRVVQDMYERSRTVVRCAVGQTEEFNVEVGLHQGSALSPFLFAIVMDQLSEEVRQESPWTMMFADDIVICSESREQVEENLERWRFALERRGMKVSRSKTEYMCVNEKEGSGTVRLQGEEVKKVQEFKYLGSTVQSNGECGKEVKKRVQAGWNGWRKVSGVLCDGKISARIKGKVYRTVVRPAMLYGLETVSLRKRQESELEVAELKILRFSLGVTRLDRIRNEYIRGTAHVGRLGDKVSEAELTVEEEPVGEEEDVPGHVETEWSSGESTNTEECATAACPVEECAAAACPVEECAAAVAKLIGVKSIVTAARMNKSVVMFVDDVSKAETVVLNGVVIKGTLVKVFPLSTPARRVILSNVPPFINDEDLCTLLSWFGKVVSPVKMLRTGCKDPELRHIYSYRQQAFMILNNRDEDLNVIFKTKTDGEEYTIYATSGSLKCFGCGQEGHLARNCPRRTGNRQWWDHGKVLIQQLCREYTVNITRNITKSLKDLEIGIVELQVLAESTGDRRHVEDLKVKKALMADLLGTKAQDFYQDLYRSEHRDSKELLDIFYQGLPKFSSEDNAALEGSLVPEELQVALNTMPGGKAPGIDSLPVEFYKFFWKELGEDLLEVLEESCRERCLPLNSQRAVITLVPKKGDLQDIKNWHPVSLLCTDYKVMSKALANRLRDIMDSVIHVIQTDQTYCVPNRSIIDNVSLIRDILDVSRSLAVDLGLISLDQEEAFDRVEHQYLWKTLEAFGLSPSLIAMMKMQLEKAIALGNWSHGLPQLPAWTLFKRGSQGPAVSLYWILEEPLVGGGRMDSSPGLALITQSKKFTTLKRVVDTAGPEFKYTRAVAEELSLRSLRYTEVIMQRWTNKLSEDELNLIKEYHDGTETPDRGKGRELADMMERRKVDILCVQETRWKGSKARSIGAGFKLFYYGVDSKRNGVGVVLKEEFVRNVLEVGCELEEKERFWSELDEVMESIPTGERVVIGADFNGHVGEGNTGDEEVMGKFGVKERNLEGQMVVDFAKRMDMAVVSTYFQKREEHRVTYKSGGRSTQKLRQALGGQVVLPDDWETTAEVIRETGRKVLGVSSGRRKEDKETWWWNEEVQDSVQRKRLAKKKWDMDKTEENRQEYKELQRRVKREVSKAK
ncbi:hypothetical protein QTP86_017665 [Hemibagrus guttatus]|nr:hypothetical protein QTP86_017665 [Hemibagrus guttatus]